MQHDYKIYQDFLGGTPSFLEKYIELDIFQRLKDISFLCGMKYASKDMYDFSCDISRYDHSINVAKVTWHFTRDRKATIAALFHDIATPVFSHVIDVMNGDAVKQESTEEKTYEILSTCEKLQQLLYEDGIRLEDICDFKKYTIVDLERPKLCADRLDGTLSTAMAWANIADARSCEYILKSLIVEKNEDSEEELAFDNYQAASYFKEISDMVNKLTHSKEDKYMMNLLARVVRRCIELKLFRYDDLFVMTEHQVIDIIEGNVKNDIDLLDLWIEFKTTSDVGEHMNYETKEKIINPLILGKRLI